MPVPRPEAAHEAPVPVHTDDARPVRLVDRCRHRDRRRGRGAGGAHRVADRPHTAAAK